MSSHELAAGHEEYSKTLAPVTRDYLDKRLAETERGIEKSIRELAWHMWGATVATIGLTLTGVFFLLTDPFQALKRPGLKPTRPRRPLAEEGGVLVDQGIDDELHVTFRAGWLPTGHYRTAEGVGFEPTVRFPVRLISSQVPSTAQPPFLRRGAGLYNVVFALVEREGRESRATRFQDTYDRSGRAIAGGTI